MMGNIFEKISDLASEFDESSDIGERMCELCKDVEKLEQDIASFNKLYHAANIMLAALAAEGSITECNETIRNMMAVLRDIDGGYYSPEVKW